MKHKYIIPAFLLVLFLLLSYPVIAAEADPPATDITASTVISGSGYSSFGFLQDGNITSYRTSSGNASITLENSLGIASVYLYFDLEYGSYTITNNDTGISAEAGQYCFLHEFVDLQSLFDTIPTSVTLHFQNGAVRLSEIYCFSQGQTPDFVQKWQPPLEGGADIVLFSAHSDDDQLFFAGLIPLYAGEKQCRVQVVLMTDHRVGPNATMLRTHEVINGLWASGLTAYPVFGDYIDRRIDSLDGMYAYYERLGVTRDQMLEFVVTQIRRFKPQVAITHDVNGEYGHGMHRIYADLVSNAVQISADPAQYPASAEKYGTWDVFKTYLHLYGENQIVLDYDTPLEHFGGLSAFQVSQQLGYPCHKTQQNTWFTRWLNGNNGQITKATQIVTYNPAHFGLYRSTVGEDVVKNDFLENIVTYAEQERRDQEAANTVIALINAIGTVTLDSGDAIADARNAYDALTDAQKALISDTAALSNAELELEQLKLRYAQNLSAAQEVMALIDRIGAVTLDSEVDISAASDAYEALTQEQKAMVSNYFTLRTAHSTLTELQLNARAEEARLKNQRQNHIKWTIWAVSVLVIGIIIYLIFHFKNKNKKFSKNEK